MSHAYHFATVFRIRLFLHWTVLFPLLWANLTLGPYAWVQLGLFAVVLLHEFGHVLAARSFGMRCSGVFLFALGGVAMIQGFNKKGTAWNQLAIALAGPAVNVLLAPGLIWLAVWTRNPGVALLAIGNAGMLVLNLLPVFPLDGGRCLHAVMWMCFGRRAGLVVAVRASQALALCLGAVAAYHAVWVLAVVMLFAMMAAQQELDARLAEDAETDARREARLTARRDQEEALSR